MTHGHFAALALFTAIVLAPRPGHAQGLTPIPGKVTALKADIVHVTFQPHASAVPSVGDSVVFTRLIAGRAAHAGFGRVTEVVDHAAIVQIANGRADFETTAVIHATGKARGSGVPKTQAPPDAPAAATGPPTSTAPPAPTIPTSPITRPTPPTERRDPPGAEEFESPRPRQQPRSVAPRQSVGIMAGVSTSTFVMTGADDAVSNRSGFQAGILVRAPVNRAFAVESDFLYAQKGAYFPGSDRYTYQLDWVQINVLGVLRLAPSTTLAPFLLAGPSAGFNVVCKLVNPDRSSTCKQVKARIKTNDFSAVVGAGLEIGSIVISGRYDIGVANISDEPGETVKNRVKSINVGVMFGSRP